MSDTLMCMFYISNNVVARFHGALKNRTKSSRGSKETGTLLDGWAIHNIRPHQSLMGRTPAQGAGLGVRGWHELITLATAHNSKNEKQLWPKEEVVAIPQVAEA